MMAQQRKTPVLLLLLLGVSFSAVAQAADQERENSRRTRRGPSDQTQIDLSQIPYRLLFESRRRTIGRENWDLFIVNADGSDPVNVTNTPNVDEMYAHVSPDGTKICFVADEGVGRNTIRSSYFMNLDGSGRVKIAEHARQPCWSFDSKSIAYLQSEYKRFSAREYATDDLMIYDIETGIHRPHPNRKLEHLYAICWAPYGRWFLGVIHGGLGFSDTILAFDAMGTRVFDLARWGVKGCRPDLSTDGKTLVWGETDENLCLADIDLMSSEPRVDNVREILRCDPKFKVYHVDLSPDGKHIAFSYGPSRGDQQVAELARGWDICVGDLNGRWVKVTTDGNHNKEPDWVPISPAKP